ncbi:MAG: Hint domain-containing protein [Planctomycetota bacterium]|jgi:hypothetical protein
MSQQKDKPPPPRERSIIFARVLSLAALGLGCALIVFFLFHRWFPRSVWFRVSILFWGPATVAMAVAAYVLSRKAPEPRPAAGARAVGLALGIGGTLLAWGTLALLYMTIGKCVAEGTAIATPQGPRPVEVLSVGDAVCSMSDDGRAVRGIVTAVHGGFAASHLRVSLSDGRLLNATSAHLVAGERGWVRAGELLHEQRVRTDTGLCEIRAVLEVRALTRVYDIVVHPYCRFFANGVLVHNKSPETYTHEHFVGTWIGYSGQGFGHHRMVLASDGTGVLAVPYPGNVCLYKVGPLHPGSSFSPPCDFHLRPAAVSSDDGKPPMLEARGRLRPARIDLSVTVHDQGTTREYTVVLIRESEVKKAQEHLREAVQRYTRDESEGRPRP